MEEKSDIEQLSLWIKKRWERFQKAIEVFQSGKKPLIKSFYTDELFLAQHGKIHLHWQAENFHYLSINNQVGDVTDKNHIMVRVEPNVRSFTITAYGGMNKTSQTIHIEPVSFHNHKIPKARVAEPTIDMKLPKLQSKHANQKGKDTLNYTLTDFGVKLPETPQEADLEVLRNNLKEAFKVRELEALQHQLEKLKQTDLLDRLNDIDYNQTPSSPK